MAYEPGGGSGEPYSRYEDLNYDPRYSIQEWISNMMQQGNVGVAPPMGTNMPDFAQDPMYGRQPPSDLRPDDFIREMLDRQQQLNPEGEPGNEYRDEEYQVAGDVVPLRPSPVQASDARMRLQTPGVGARSQGMQSINNFGGPDERKYLDLMDVLMGRFGK